MHAILAAVVLWILAIFNLTGTGNRSIAGPLKGADFPYFYTIGSLARTHQVDSLYDFAALHRAQVSHVSVASLPAQPQAPDLRRSASSRLWHYRGSP